jgi:NADH:ubiquinone reductase (H+-translocating)
VVVGGGPTGVELAGAIAELAFNTLKDDFRNIDPSETQILLLEGMDRVLPPYDPELSQKAAQSLEKFGVTVRTKTLVTQIDKHQVTVKSGNTVEQISAQTILWAAGVQASGMGKILAESTGASLDRVGRVMVEPDLTIADYPNIFVIGDLCHYAHQGDSPLPGVAPVAMQEGLFVAKLLQAKLNGQPLPKFKYKDVGNLAVIGHNQAVIDLKFAKLTGPLAWFAWVFVHIYYLIEFDNKVIVLLQWSWNYVTRKRGARLITGKDSLVQPEAAVQAEA